MADKPETTAVAAKPDTPKLRAERILYQINDIIQTALPSTISRDKFRDVFLTAAVKEPKIFLADRPSVQQALIASANSGLMPDGKMAALVPFKNTKANKLEVQFIIMVMGYIHLFKKHAGVHSMTVNVVRQKDEFTYIEGFDTVFEHRPQVFSEDRGDMIGVYAIFRDKDEKVMHLEIMSRADVMKAKAVSKMSNSGPWQNFEEEMWRKTVVRRSAKYLPLTDEGQKILDAEDAATIDFDLPARQLAPMDYNPMAIAAGLQDPGADEDGVVEDDMQVDDEQQQGDQGDQRGEQDGDNPLPDEEIDLDEVVEAEETKVVEKPVEKVVEKPNATEKPKATDKVAPRKYSDRELDAAWDAGIDAKEAGEPRTPPETLEEGLHPTWFKAWDKAKSKAAPKETKATATQPSAPIPDADIVRDAKAKAMDGADREVPDGTPEDQHQHWLDAFDQQTKEVNENG